ncbi:MAG: helix-turn-helix domain-containing protein [Dermatophilaceae bacterium]
MTGLHRADIRVTGRDAVRAALLSSYDIVVRLEPTPAAPAASLTFATRTARSDGLSVDRFRLGGSGTADTRHALHAGDSSSGRSGAEPALAACVMHRGHVRFDPRGGAPVRSGPAARFGPGEVFRYPDGGFQAGWDDVTADLVRVPMPLVRRYVEEITGDVPVGFRFLSISPVTAAEAQLWRATTALVADQLMRPGGPAEQPLVREAMTRTVVTAAVSVFATPAADDHLRPGPGVVGSDTYRRAMAWIDEHCAEPITPADVAAATGTSARDLAAVFRRRRGTGLTGYVRWARLAAARDALRRAPGGVEAPVLVAQVGARLGFVDLAEFERAYRRRFGNDPADDVPS